MSAYTNARARLTNPDPVFSPAPIWWWSGEALNSDRIRWQLEQFAAGGVYNLVILNLAPAGPLHGSLADEPPFLSDAWWQIFVTACQDAQRLGIKLWFYDQIGFSGANLQGTIIREHPAFTGQVLGSQVIACSGVQRVDFPDGCIPLAAWAMTSHAQPQQLTVHAHQCESVIPVPHQVRLVYALNKGFDYMSVAACATLRATVHEAFYQHAGAFFGDVIVGSFQDELPSMPTWSHDFAETFHATFGYNLIDALIALYEGDDAHSQQVRIDYQTWRATRAEQAFFKPFYDWHAKHGLICGFDQQSPARMALPVGAVDEYADYLQTHRWYGAPGSDHHGNGKIHSSLAHLYGHPRSWIEAFHSSGWGGTLEETFDWLVPWLRAGLTLYNPHAVYYSTRGGWWEWAPPSTCWRQPYWRHYAHFSRAIMRVMGVMSLGAHQCDIAVLFPTTTVQAHLRASGPLPAATHAEHVFVELTGSMFWNNPKPGLLDRQRRDFDMIDNDSLARAQSRTGMLCVADESYRYLILPAITHLPPACIQALNTFVDAGGTIFAVATLPVGLNVHPRIHMVESVAALEAALDALPRRITGDVHVLERRVDGGRIVLVTPTVSASQFHWNGHWNSTPYDFDARRLPQSVRITIEQATSIEQWSVTDGSVQTLAPIAPHTWEIWFDDAPIVLLFVPDHAPMVPLSAPRKVAQLHSILRQDWHVSIEPTADNRWGDFAYPAGGMLLPQTIRFNDVHMQTHTQGFGVYAWSYGPVPRSTLPAPCDLAQVQTTGLADAHWQPVVYSLERGILHDSIHWGMLGPKGYVPEEFLHFGTVAAGDAVRVRTTVMLTQSFAGAFVLGAPTDKCVWLDGVAYTDCVPGYQWFVDVTWDAGMHVIEFELAPEQTLNLRAYWALVHAPARFRRPNWIMQGDTPQSATTLTFSHTFMLDTEAAHAQMMVIADVPVRVLLDDREIGRQGGYDPYGSTVRVQPYEIGTVSAGSHTIAVVALDGGRGVSLLVDMRCTHANATTTTVMSGAGWYVQRGQVPLTPARIRRRQWVDLTFDTDHALYVDMDPGWPLIWRRPHPLPRAHWLESAHADDTVLACVPDAYAGKQRSTTLHWRIPVGTTGMRIATSAHARVWIDDQEYMVRDGLVAYPVGACMATLQLDAAHGATGAAMLDAPISYTWSRGVAMLPASWQSLGLGDYAGAVAFETVFNWTITNSALLCLREVRGTAEVWLNQQPLGVRLWSPYQFDLTPALKRGQNTLRIVVTGTLAPYMAGHSPTHYAPAHQEITGILGDIEIVLQN